MDKWSKVVTLLAPLNIKWKVLPGTSETDTFIRKYVLKKISKLSSPLFSADYHHKGYTSHWQEIFMVLRRQARWMTYLMPVLMKSCSTLR